MKVMLAAFVAIAVTSVGSNSVLKETGFATQERASDAAVRLDD